MTYTPINLSVSVSILCVTLFLNACALKGDIEPQPDPFIERFDAFFESHVRTVGYFLGPGDDLIWIEIGNCFDRYLVYFESRVELNREGYVISRWDKKLTVYELLEQQEASKAGESKWHFRQVFTTDNFTEELLHSSSIQEFWRKMEITLRKDAPILDFMKYVKVYWPPQPLLTD